MLRFVLFLFLFLVPFSSSIQSNNFSLTFFDRALANNSNEFERIQKSGKLRIAMYSKESYPFAFRSQDLQKQWTGFDIELAQILAKKLNLKLEIIDKAKSFDEVIQIVSKNEADIAISKLSMTTQRARQVLFSKAYKDLKIGVAYNRLKFSNNFSSDYKNEYFNQYDLKLGILENSAYVEYAQSRFPRAKIQYFKDRNEIYHAIAKGLVDFSLADEVVMRNWQKENPSFNLHISYSNINEAKDSIGIAVNFQNLLLRDWINIALDEIINSGEMTNLKHKYFAKL